MSKKNEDGTIKLATTLDEFRAFAEKGVPTSIEKICKAFVPDEIREPSKGGIGSP